MLSILIPTYKYNALPLVTSLHQQAIACNIPFEIICFDDGSPATYNEENKKINTLAHAYFESLTNNVGLSQSRNLLIQKAAYDAVLLIDSDSTISTTYLNQYVSLLPTTKIIYGGTSYAKELPDPKKRLRWKYGIAKEEIPPKKRNKAPYQNIHFNNTLLHKKHFEHLLFDKNISTYGHEDTLFAYQAMQKSIALTHIDNPVQHEGIDEDTIFLAKTCSAIKNLFRIAQRQQIDYKFITLLRYYTLIKKMRMRSSIAWIFKKFEKQLLKNLTSGNPSLLLFDLYKLGFFCTLKNPN